MFDFPAYLAQCRRAVDGDLESRLKVNGRCPTGIQAAMGYSLMAGGKRVRPALCLAAADAVGAADPDRPAILAAAGALEMIHTYSLIHDDLPAMDDDDLRRGRATCHVAFDEATAVLAGDGLLTLAFETLSQAAIESDINPGRWIEVMRIVAGAAGHQGMIEGQMRDMAAEQNPLELHELEKMHALKTGALIVASVETGAILGGARPDQIERLREYAGHIGLAFQVMDDILNVTGDPELLGKATGTDLERNKSTYPALMGLAGSQRLAGDLISKALRALDIFDNRSEPLEALATYIIARHR